MLYTPLLFLLLTTSCIHASPLYTDDSLATSDDKLHPLDDIKSTEESYVASEEDKQALRDLLVTIPAAKDNVEAIMDQMTHQPADILNAVTEGDLLRAAQGGLLGGLLGGLGSIIPGLAGGLGSLIPGLGGLLGGPTAPTAPTAPSIFPPQYPGFPPQYQYGGFPPQYGGFPPQYGGFPPQYGGFPPQYGGPTIPYRGPPRGPPGGFGPPFGRLPGIPRPGIRPAKRDLTAEGYDPADATDDTSASEEMEFDAAQVSTDPQASTDAQGSGDQVSAAQFGFPDMGFGTSFGWSSMGFGGGFPGMGFPGFGFGGGFPGFGIGGGFPGFGWRGRWGWGGRPWGWGGRRRWWKRDEFADPSELGIPQATETYDQGLDASTEESQASTEQPQANQEFPGFPSMFPFFPPDIGFIHPRVYISTMSRFPHLFVPVAPFFPIELIRQTVAVTPGSITVGQ